MRMSCWSTRCTILFLVLSLAVLHTANALTPMDGRIRPPRLDPTLPDPLKTNAGEIIATVEEWENVLRPETLEHFRESIYGRMPVGRPDDLTFEVKETDPAAMGGMATLKLVDIRFSGSGGTGMIELVLFIPNEVEGPAPGFLMINHRDRSNTDPTRQTIRDFWPAEVMVERGYMAAAFHVSDVSPDSSSSFHIGVLRIFDPPGLPRAPDAWGSLAAWAWGAARAMDYFETDPDIDETRMAVIGHSRSGKAALWAGAEDERYALVISNNSGRMGAAVSRRRIGETVDSIVQSFPRWFCENVQQFALREDALPVDQHQLIALMAPRLVYVASGIQDAHADPEGEFLACVHAEPVFNLYGSAGLGVEEMPATNHPLHDGHVAYHIRSGGHALTLYDWNRFMDYADRHWGLDGWARGHPWLGDHFVALAPWIYSDLWKRWMYLSEAEDSEAGAWIYIPKTNGDAGLTED